MCLQSVLKEIHAFCEVAKSSLEVVDDASSAHLEAQHETRRNSKQHIPRRRYND